MASLHNVRGQKRLRREAVACMAHYVKGARSYRKFQVLLVLSKVAMPWHLDADLGLAERSGMWGVPKLAAEGSSTRWLHSVAKRVCAPPLSDWEFLCCAELTCSSCLPANSSDSAPRARGRTRSVAIRQVLAHIPALKWAET